jgi:hypothetical protein
VLSLSFVNSEKLHDTPMLPRSTAIVRQSVAVRFLIREVWQRIFGMGRENGVWVEF